MIELKFWSIFLSFFSKIDYIWNLLVGNLEKQHLFQSEIKGGSTEGGRFWILRNFDLEENFVKIWIWKHFDQQKEILENWKFWEATSREDHSGINNKISFGDSLKFIQVILKKTHRDTYQPEYQPAAREDHCATFGTQQYTLSCGYFFLKKEIFAQQEIIVNRRL